VSNAADAYAIVKFANYGLPSNAPQVAHCWTGVTWSAAAWEILLFPSIDAAALEARTKGLEADIVTVRIQLGDHIGACPF